VPERGNLHRGFPQLQGCTPDAGRLREEEAGAQAVPEVSVHLPERRAAPGLQFESAFVWMTSLKPWGKGSIEHMFDTVKVMWDVTNP
jgi:hypothetical protein